MDADEIRTLLGDNIFERAKKYRKRIQQSTCTVNADGVRHISAMVQGSGGSYYYTQAWLRENGSFVSASCSCPYNQNGEGTYCKHIGALLLDDAEKNAPAPAAKPDAIPGVVRGAAGLAPEPARRDSYASGLEMLFGKKWHGETPVSDHEALRLLDTYKEAALENLGVDETAQRTGFAHLEPELTLVPGAQPWLRLRISDGGRQYVVKSIPNLMEAVEMGKSVSYGKALAFVHRWDAFDEESRALLQLLRRQVNARQSMDKAAVRVYGGAEQGPAGGMILTGEIFDDLVQLYEHTGFLGGYELREGLPVITVTVERRRGGVQVEGEPALSAVQGLDYDYLFSEDTLWRLQRPGCTRILPALQALGGKSLFFTSADATAFCSYVLPELGSKLNIVDPERLLLNQIPLEPVVQFYLDAPDSFRIEAHAEFLYGEDKVTPFVPSPAGLLRDVRAESRAKRLLASYLQPGVGGREEVYGTADEDEIYRMLEEGVPALLAEDVALNGVCLTATSIGKNNYSVDVMHETLRRTNLGELKSGSKVNLERAMAANGRFGGHIVAGHVDGTGTISSMKKDDNAVWITIDTSAAILKYIISKGSITIDGVSLTVAKVDNKSFAVSVIPHTGQNTTLLDKKPGDTVNLENDMVGKYVEKLLQYGSIPAEEEEGTTEKTGITMDFLIQNGF